MGYFSDYYVEEFTNDIIKKFVVILNQTEIHNKQKYLLIVVQDLVTEKIVKLVDTHGAQYDLCKYSENWAKLKKGNVISVKCGFHKSRYCVNVLRIKSDYTLIDSFDYYDEIKRLKDSTVFNDEKRNSFIKVFDTDLEFLGKKLLGKYGFILYYLKDSLVIEHTGVVSNKVKYQFILHCPLKHYYADIISYVPNINDIVDKSYSGFALLQFAYKKDRLRVKVYDFLNEDLFFKDVFEDDSDLPF